VAARVDPLVRLAVSKQMIPLLQRIMIVTKLVGKEFQGLRIILRDIIRME
jgi:hypothetical protein